MEIEKGEEKNGKSVVDSANTPQQITRYSVSFSIHMLLFFCVFELFIRLSYGVYNLGLLTFVVILLETCLKVA